MVKHVSLILIDQESQLPVHMDGDLIGVDGGAALALRQHRPMIFAIGDFDSIDQDTLAQLKKTVQVYEYPCRKDQPDSQLAIEKALELGYTTLDVYGALGGRYDHHHANLVLAYRYDGVILHQNGTIIRSYGKGTHPIKKESFEKLSLFTFESAVISITNVEYPLDHYHLSSTDILGLSNAFTDDQAILTVHEGRVLVYCGKA